MTKENKQRQNRRRWIGSEAEKRAAQAYEDSGARILEKNYRLKCGELDLVVEEAEPQGVVLVFVEVRARCPISSWETPVESLTAAKRRRLKYAADHFLLSYRGRAREIRFDLVSWDFRELKILKNFWWY